MPGRQGLRQLLCQPMRLGHMRGLPTCRVCSQLLRYFTFFYIIAIKVIFVQADVTRTFTSMARRSIAPLPLRRVYSLFL